MSNMKDQAKKIIDNLPEQATWEDLMYQLYVKKKVENSLQAAKDGKVFSHDEVKKKKSLF